jgi:hypothetical protein
VYWWASSSSPVADGVRVVVAGVRGSRRLKIFRGRRGDDRLAKEGGVRQRGSRCQSRGWGAPSSQAGGWGESTDVVTKHVKLHRWR